MIFKISGARRGRIDIRAFIFCEKHMASINVKLVNSKYLGNKFKKFSKLDFLKFAEKNEFKSFMESLRGTSYFAGGYQEESTKNEVNILSFQFGSYVFNEEFIGQDIKKVTLREFYEILNKEYSDFAEEFLGKPKYINASKNIMKLYKIVEENNESL